MWGTEAPALSPPSLSTRQKLHRIAQAQPPRPSPLTKEGRLRLKIDTKKNEGNWE